ncbi:MAG: LacI family DNA-binding transcriptional regulator [Opitutales bacterium]|nr:LacI family DNA-binding transcriptional regulator [Opitutales bacterium]
MKITQKDIAKKLGVSTSLVSRVLSGRAEEIGIRGEVIKQVQDLAKKMNYVPSMAALSLKGKKSATIGVVVYDFYDPFFTKVIGELQKVANEENFSILLVGLTNRALSEQSLRPLYKHNVDGIIIVGSYGDISWVSDFKEIPIARIGHGADKRLKLSVAVDELMAMTSICDHLLAQKVKKVVFARRNAAVHARREGVFLDVFTAKKLAQVYSLNSICENDMLAGADLVETLLKKGDLPDALVCASDVIAMAAIKRFSESGVKVPNDILITGFDDISTAACFMPSITSYRQSVEYAAQKAFYAVAKGQGNGHFDCEGSLIIRASSVKKR